jgi:hypothetical protein
MSDIQYRLWIADLLGNLHILLGLFPQKNGLIWKFVSLKGCVWAKKRHKGNFLTNRTYQPSKLSETIK